MKKIYYYIICWLLAVSMPAYMKAAETGKHEALPDSLLTEDHIYEYTFSDTVKAACIIDQMRQRKLAPEHVLDIAQGDLLFNNGKYNEALPFYERALASDSVRNDDTECMEQLHRMISCYDCLHDEVRKADYVKQLLEKAEACGNRAMESIALFNMGKMIYYQEDKEQGYRMIKKAVGLMEATDYKYKYDNLRYNYNTLFIMQQRDKRYEDALETLDLLETVVTRSTEEEPAIEDLSGKELKTLYAHRAVLFSRLGKTDEADRAYRQWKLIGKRYTKDDYLIAPYLTDRRMYDEVIKIYSARETFLHAHEDTISYHMMTIKRSLGKAYTSKGNYPAAARYFEELSVLTDSLKVREQQSSALELATVYETHKHQEEAAEQANRVKVRNAWLAGCGVALLVLLVLFVRKAQYARTIRDKNSGMVNTIQELLSYRDRLYKAEEELAAFKEKDIHASEEQPPATLPSADFPAGNEENAGAGVPPTEHSKGDSHQEEEENSVLFWQLDRIVTTEQLFTRQTISRDDLMKCIGVDKNRLLRILQQNAGINVVDYLNNKRMEYAAELLKEHPEYNIVTVANMCGMSVSTFNRTFKNKYKMTPNDFKHML